MEQKEPATLPSKKTRPSRGERQFNKDTEKALRESTSTSSGGASHETATPEEPLLDNPPTKQNRENGTVINKFSPNHYRDVYRCFAGEDNEYHPLREEEDSSSGSGGASDSDSSVSSPPQRKRKAAAAKPKHQKTVTATKRQTGGGGRKRTSEVGASRDRTKPSPATVVCTIKPHAKGVTTVASQSSPKNTTAVEPRNSSQPAAGTPGLGMRRMPHWTPPGERDF